MFFTLSKTLTILLYPLPLALILLALAWGLRRRIPRPATALFWCVLVALYALSTRPVADMLLLPLERPYAGMPRPEAADAVVVMGGFMDRHRSAPDRPEFREGVDRFLEGVMLARQIPGSVLIFAGGSGDLLDRSNPEALLAAGYAARLGIPPERIRAESASRNTWENAVETRRILEQEGLHTVVVVTSAYHMRRTLASFHRAGMAPIPHAVDFQNRYPRYDVLSVVPSPTSLGDSALALKEYLGLLAYRIKGYA